MSANINEEFSSTTKQLDTESLCAVARDVVHSASHGLTAWHPQGTSVSARTEMITGALDEIVLALGERWTESVDVTIAINEVWAKLGELNSIN